MHIHYTLLRLITMAIKSTIKMKCVFIEKCIGELVTKHLPQIQGMTIFAYEHQVCYRRKPFWCLHFKFFVSLYYYRVEIVDYIWIITIKWEKCQGIGTWSNCICGKNGYLLIVFEFFLKKESGTS